MSKWKRLFRAVCTARDPLLRHILVYETRTRIPRHSMQTVQTSVLYTKDQLQFHALGCLFIYQMLENMLRLSTTRVRELEFRPFQFHQLVNNSCCLILLPSRINSDIWTLEWLAVPSAPSWSSKCSRPQSAPPAPTSCLASITPP